jgi:hypothetical protein
MGAILLNVDDQLLAEFFCREAFPSPLGLDDCVDIL